MSYKELFILRHAKSSWDEPDKEDIDRALTTRGIKDAYTVANRIKNQLKRVDLIITSHANRAMHTTVIFADILRFPFDKIRVSANIYESSDIQMQQMINAFVDEYSSILIVGHNPTFTYLANRFLVKPIDNIPTTGIVGMSFNSSTWKDVSRENLQSSFFDFPKK